MLIATLKSYILHEEKFGSYDIRIVRLDSSDLVELEIEKDRRVVVRKKMDNIDTAKRFLKKIKDKFDKKDTGKRFNLNRKKEARINSDHPKAFMPGSPSESPFQSHGPGGLLKNVEELKNKNNPYNKKRNRKNDQRGKKWFEPSGREKDDGFQLSRWGPPDGVSRDSGKDRDGYERAMGTEQEGARPSLPTGEDSIDVMKNPNDYNPIYDSGYPGDRTTWQDVEDDRRHNKQLKNQETIQKGKETFKLLVNNKGDEEDLMNLTFQEAIQKSRMYPGSKIVREKRR